MNIGTLEKNKSEQIIKELNLLIKSGVIDVSMNNPDSLVVQVFGVEKARFKNLLWEERRGTFLGGGIYDSDGYWLKTKNDEIHISDYGYSLRMFLNYVYKKMDGELNG